MKFLIMAIKLFIVFAIGFYIKGKLENKDTSVLYAFTSKKLKEIFPKKISKLEKYFKKLSMPFD